MMKIYRIIFFYFLVTTINAQDIWYFYPDVNDESIAIHAGLINTGSCTVSEQFVIDTSHVEDLIPSGSFSFSPDGDVYYYSLTNAIVKIKLPEQELELVNFNTYPEYFKKNHALLKFGPDSLLYLVPPENTFGTSRYYIKYNLTTNAFGFPSIVKGIEETLLGVTFMYNKIYFTSQGLYDLDKDAQAHYLLDGNYYNISSGVTIRHDCDSSRIVFRGGKVVDENDNDIDPPPDLSLYNFDTKEIVNLCSNLPLPEQFEIALPFDQSTLNNCFIEIDVDADDSSQSPDIIGDVFYDTLGCDGVITGFGDEDWSVDGNVPIDKIKIYKIATADVYLDFPEYPGIEVIGDRNSYEIYFSEELLLEDVESFVKNIEGHVSGNPFTEYILLPILFFNHDILYNEVYTQLLSPAREIFAPSDIAVLECESDSLNILDEIIDLFSAEGRWLTDKPIKIGEGIYKMQYEVNDIWCGPDTSLLTITFLPNPNVNIMGNEILCEDETQDLNIDVDTVVDIVWSGGEKDQTLPDTGPGIYSVSVTDGNGCVGSDTLEVNTDIKSYQIIPEGDICDQLKLSVSGDDFQSASWSTGEEGATIMVQKSDSISVIIIDENGCDYTISTFVEKCPYHGDIANIFSPNEDGINDEICFSELGDGNMHVIIYDRWGGKIYECQSSDCCWDGKMNDRSVVQGVYTALVIMENQDGETTSIVKDVTVVY